MAKKTRKNILSIALVFLVLAGLYVGRFVFDLEPKLGLDLKGGTSLVYKAKATRGKKVSQSDLKKTVEIIRKRVDRLGMTEPDIAIQGSDNVVVQMPGIHDPERAKEIVGKTAQLEFRLVLDSKEESEAKAAGWKLSKGKELNPDSEVILPLEEGGKAFWLKLGPTQLMGDIIKRAQVAYSQEGKPIVSFELTEDGKKKFGDLTTANQGKQLAIVLDYMVESAPNIKEPITDGRGQIEGDFTESEVKDLALVLNTGALPLSLELVNEMDLTATLGEDALKKSLIVGAIGLALVGLFMLIFYRMLGFVTCFSLAIFIALMYGFISVLGNFWTLTLAGVAGIVVSIGMAVDSSIVYFERLKEDVRAGRTIRVSAERAYKSAFKTILSADAVSLIAAVILYVFSVSSVKGFAFTLGMSTIFDVFLSYFFTRPVTAFLSLLPFASKPAAIRVRAEGLQEAGGSPE
ncbi:MAG: protein translocase subunit SecD [Actinomycetota bacterium]|nr:protein translocase subunit SecD [Actinomycetota bacterium]